MTYAEFLHGCLAADARKTAPPAVNLVRRVLARLRGQTGPRPGR